MGDAPWKNPVKSKKNKPAVAGRRLVATCQMENKQTKSNTTNPKLRGASAKSRHWQCAMPCQTAHDSRPRSLLFSGIGGSKLRVEVDKTPFPEAVLAVACNIRNKTGVASNGRF